MSQYSIGRQSVDVSFYTDENHDVDGEPRGFTGDVSDNVDVDLPNGKTLDKILWHNLAYRDDEEIVFRSSNYRSEEIDELRLHESNVGTVYFDAPSDFISDVTDGEVTKGGISSHEDLGLTKEEALSLLPEYRH